MRGSVAARGKRVSKRTIFRIVSVLPEGPVSEPRSRSFWASCEPRKPPPPVMMTFMDVSQGRGLQSAPARCGMHACSMDKALSGHKIGFVGLGNMGGAMSRHLHAADARMVVWNRSEPRATAAVALGMQRAVTLPELAAEIGDGIICINLTTTEVVEQVVFGAGGLCAGFSAGTLIVDFGTTSVNATKEFAKRVAWVDAPVSGGQVGAERGDLTILAGGTEAAFQRALPILQTVGKRITHLGPAGSGQVAKLANQLIVA